MATFSEKVFEAVRMIPKGSVSTYGDIARIVGSPRSARYVGYALRRSEGPESTPCHRVVFKDGELPEAYIFGGPGIQRQMLEEEGVTFLDNGRVDIKKHLWDAQSTFPDRPIDIDWSKEMGD